MRGVEFFTRFSKKLKERSSSYSPLSLAEVKKKNSSWVTAFHQLERSRPGFRRLVEGSLILLSGDPGIGKSTLLLKIAEGIAREGKVLC